MILNKKKQKEKCLFQIQIQINSMTICKSLGSE